MGRLHDKYVGIPEVSQQRLKNKLQSYCHFKTIVDYCATHEGMEEVLKNELPICYIISLLDIFLKKQQKEFLQ